MARFFTLFVIIVMSIAGMAAMTANGNAQSDTSAISPTYARSGAEEIYQSLTIRTNSPRQTLQSFVTLRKELESAIAAYRQNQNFRNSDRVTSILGELRSLVDKSSLPAGSRRHITYRTMAYILEILGRVDLPNLDDVPDNPGETGEATLAKYRIPGTPIQLVRIDAGPRISEFLFSGQTIKVAPRFFQGIENLPLRTSLGIASWTSSFAQLTGPLIPMFVSSSMPAKLKIMLLDTAIWKLVTAIGVITIAFYVWTAFYRFLKGRRSLDIISSQLVSVLGPISGLGILLTVKYFVEYQIIVNGRFLQLFEFIAISLYYISLASIFWTVILYVFNYSRVPSDENLNANMMRMIVQIVAVIGATCILAYGAQELGVPVLSLAAGLGIGGLAVALAIRPTLENLIGGFILHIDKPVRLGDLCEFGDRRGTVEKIGIRSTQLRSLDRTLVTIPNSQFADMQIVNWANCDQMLIGDTIGLRYETEGDQLRYVLAKIREMFHSHPRIDTETIRVRFDGYGMSSLDISIRVYAKTRERNDFFAIKEDVFLRIGDIVKQSGTGFAFPSQTLYLGRDKGVDAELGEKANQEVAAWRRSRKFPFPRFATNQLEKWKDTLPYPPRGSPEFNATEEELSLGTEQLSAEPLEEESTEQEQEKK
jgi:MscS family membrane protein